MWMEREASLGFEIPVTKKTYADGIGLIESGQPCAAAISVRAREMWVFAHLYFPSFLLVKV